MKYLIQFLDDWIDFRLTEFISILEMNGYNAMDIIYRWRFEEEMIPFEEIETKYLQFLQSFRETVIAPDATTTTTTKETIQPSKHFLIVNFPEAVDIARLFQRAVLIKAIYELWADATTLQDILSSLQALPSDFIHPLLQSNFTWSIQIDSFGRTYTMENKQYLRQFFSFLTFHGPVSLKSPQLELWLILDYISEHERHQKGGGSVNDASYLQSILTSKDATIYFGRKLHDNQEMKKILQKYTLKKRIYIGPTSLDNVLAMILANFAKITPGTIAYEPFMGTGSIAIALEHFGCLCIGSDIDPRILRGEMYAGYNGNSRQDINEKILPAALRKDSHSSSNTSLLQSSSASSTPPVPAIVSVAQEEEKTDRADTNKKNKKQQPSFSYRTDYHPRKVNGDVRSNFHQYSLPIPDLIRMDHHLLNRHLHSFVRKNFFDIIVTDPPYGIRAGARKSGKKEQVDYSISQEKRIDHIPSTQAYPVEEVMLDLLHTAAETLRLGGILVYLIPTAYNFELKDLPHHPCLQLIDSCHQPLSARHGRRAVIMRKARENTANLAEEFQVYKERVMSGQDDGFGLLLKKLITALQADAFDNDIVVKRLGSCCERRKESRERRRKQREEGIVFPVKHPFPKLRKKAQKLRLGVSDIPSNEEELALEEVDEEDLSSGSDQIDSFEQR